MASLEYHSTVVAFSFFKIHLEAVALHCCSLLEVRYWVGYMVVMKC